MPQDGWSCSVFLLRTNSLSYGFLEDKLWVIGFPAAVLWKSETIRSHGEFPYSFLEAKNISGPLDFSLQPSGMREHCWAIVFPPLLPESFLGHSISSHSFAEVWAIGFRVAAFWTTESQPELCLVRVQVSSDVSSVTFFSVLMTIGALELMADDALSYKIIFVKINQAIAWSLS